jgi:UDP-N-acetyl-D-galactosamine dehydrogenase
VLAVAHDRFRELGEQGLRNFGRRRAVLFDVKCLLPPGTSDGRL